MAPLRTTVPRPTHWRAVALALGAVCGLGIVLQVAAFVEARSAVEASAALGAVVPAALERSAWLALSATAVSVLGLLAVVVVGAFALGAALANLAAANAQAVRTSVQLAVSESRWRALEEEALGTSERLRH